MYRYIVYCAGGGALQAGYWERAVIAFGQSRNSPSRSAFFIRIQRADRRFKMTFTLLLVTRFPERRWACLTSLDAPNCTYA